MRLRKKILDFVAVKSISFQSTCSRPNNVFTAFFLVKEGADFIGAFIHLYFKLGFKRTAFIDNGSQDEALETASEFEKVHVIKSDLPYRNFKFCSRFLALVGHAISEKHCFKQCIEYVGYSKGMGADTDCSMMPINSRAFLDCNQLIRKKVVCFSNQSVTFHNRFHNC